MREGRRSAPPPFSSDCLTKPTVRFGEPETASGPRHAPGTCSCPGADDGSCLAGHSWLNGSDSAPVSGPAAPDPSHRCSESSRSPGSPGECAAAPLRQHEFATCSASAPGRVRSFAWLPEPLPAPTRSAPSRIVRPPLSSSAADSGSALSLPRSYSSRHSPRAAPCLNNRRSEGPEGHGTAPQLSCVQPSLRPLQDRK